LSAGSDGAAAGLAGRIENTLVGQAVTADRVDDQVAGAVRFGFGGVIVPGCWIPLARDLLHRHADAGVARTAGRIFPRLGGILDFPYGSSTTAQRLAGAAALVAAGAEEIDSTVNIGLLLSGRHAEFDADLVAVVRAAGDVPVRFMLELPLLNVRQRERVVASAVAAGAAAVKNASRGSVGIADPAQIAFLRRTVPDTVGVKASGGIKTIQQVRELLAAGADLIGTSSGVAIVTGVRETSASLEGY
jgi:deoxyribose-phosphate aldolase